MFHFNIVQILLGTKYTDRGLWFTMKFVTSIKMRSAGAIQTCLPVCSRFKITEKVLNRFRNFHGSFAMWNVRPNSKMATLLEWWSTPAVFLWRLFLQSASQHRNHYIYMHMSFVIHYWCHALMIFRRNWKYNFLVSVLLHRFLPKEF